MTTLHAQDANNVLVAGENGTVIRSTDGGVTWTKQHFQISETLSDVRFIDASNVWVVGSSGALYRSSNGGSSWISVPSGTTKALYAVGGSGNVLCAVGFDGKIIRSSDGGNTWSSPIAENRLRFYEDIHFTNATSAVIVGSGSGMLRTTDAGVTWNSISLGTSWIKEVSFANSLKGWAVGITATYISITDDVFYGISTNIQGKRSTIWKTTDGGQTWGVGVLPTTTWLDGVHFVDTTTGWVVGENGLILKTTDGGTNWTTQASGTPARLNAVCFFDNQKGIVVGPSGMILRTTNGGSVWSLAPSGTTNNLNSVALYSQQIGIAVGEGGTILMTTNGGVSWQSLSGGTAVWLYAMQRIGTLDAWVAGTNGSILRSTDGGVTWTIKSCGTTDNLEGLAFSDAQNGWAVGYRSVFRTTDGGNSWAKTWTGTDGYFKALWFAGTNDGWIAGYKGSYPYTGVVKRTSDGGTTWSDQSIPAVHSLSAIYFLDGSTGFAVGDSGKILKTTTGGTTWSSQFSGTTNTLNAIGFATSLVGWAVGQNGTILKTTDGGVSWGRQSSNASAYASFSSVSPVSASTAWIAGYDVVLRTTNGGGTMLFTPLPSTPAQNGLGVPTTTTFRWGKSMGASSYRLQISRSSSFSTFVVDRSDLTDTSSTVTNLESNATYYWRVCAVYGSETSFWSETRKFETVGIVWRNQSPSGYARLEGVHFVNRTTGWAVGSSGMILKTTTGGKTWNTQTVAGNPYLNSACFVDSLRGWVVGDNGTIFATTNGGGSWNTQVSGVTHSLYSVKFLDASSGWIASGQGTVLKTANGGVTWGASSTGTTSELFSIFPVDASVVWAVENYGLYKSTDGGVTWSKKYSPSSARDVRFVNSQRGWLLETRGISRTSDGGTSWTWVSSGTDSDLNAFWFLDSLRGWAVGSNGVMVYTADGGLTWQTKTSGTSSNLYDICFVNDATGWIVGSNVILKATTSLGISASTPTLQTPINLQASVSLNPTLTWIPVIGAQSYRVQVCRYSWSDNYTWLDSANVTSPFLKITSLWSSTQYFWRISAYDDDGPSLWSPVWNFTTGSTVLSAPSLSVPPNQSTGLQQNLVLQWRRVEDAISYKVQLSTSSSFTPTIVDQTLTDTLYAVSGLAAGTEYYWRVLANASTGSSSWSSVWSFSTAFIGPVPPVLLSPAQGSTDVGSSATFSWRRSVGAVSYRIQLSASPSFSPLLLDHSLADTTNSVASLIPATVYYWRVQAIDNAGLANWSSTWSFSTAGSGWKSSTISGSYRSICFVGNRLGWMAGNSGISATTDGGATWNAQGSGISMLRSICFVDANVGWAAGSNGVILKTTNGGLQWFAQTSGVTNEIRGVSMSDANNGWAVAENTILRTTNGGDSWTSQIAPKLQYIYGVKALSSSKGIVYGGSLLLRTTDGGAVWTSEQLPDYGFLQGCWFIDANTGWVVGADGVMFKTTNGGAEWVRVHSGTDRWITSIHFVDAQQGWAAGWNGLVLRTTDGGASWGRQISGATSSLYGLYFIDALNGWVVGGQNIKTTDGGGVAFYPPVLRSPALNATNTSIRPTFEWELSAGAVSYQLQVATSSSMYAGSLVINDSALTVTARQTSPLSVQTSYFWRVLSYLSNGSVMFSPVWSFRTGTSATWVDALQGVPENFQLHQNYPNPFNPSTTIEFDVPDESYVEIKIYSSLGSERASLVSSVLTPGRYRTVWNAGKVSSGVYFCRMQARDFTMTRKLILLK